MSFQFRHPYDINPVYQKKVAYFCMEYAIHQPLKIYAGGLGFLAGSYMRSAFDLHQNMVGIGVLWKYGYYDQVRKQDLTMDVLFEEKIYGFLQDTGIRFTIKISKHDVWVTAYYLPPETFHTAPLFFLSTDLPENDYLSKTICHKLYDPNPEAKIAAAILLGIGGAKLLEMLNWEPEIYHLNESHGLPLAFYLYNKFKNLQAVRQRLVFTNHTPEDAGNQKTLLSLLEKMGFFCDVPITEVCSFAKLEYNLLDHSITALLMAKMSNAVSKIHLETMRVMWKEKLDGCKMISITNAQNKAYWWEEELYKALENNNDEDLLKSKREGKRNLFEVVADQCGEIYEEQIFTLVFAKRFAGYKRADLLLQNMERFERLISNKERPIQIIWAGKPYPMDFPQIGVFDKIVDLCKTHKNCSILSGYELRLSKLLKHGADAWLNLPRLTHEASGTSGMTAAMNGAINLSLPDGWFPEFTKDKVNSFLIPACDIQLPEHLQDEEDAISVYDLLEKEVLPMYYDYPNRWIEIMKNSMRDILPAFDSARMADEYYRLLYEA